MAYRRRNRLRRRNARPTTKRALKRVGRGIKGVTSVAYRRPGYGTGGLGAFGTRLGRVGRQRNAARAALLMQRRRRRAGVGGGGEIGWVKRRYGKYRSPTARKLNLLGMNKLTMRYQGVNRMNADSSGDIQPDGSVTGVPVPGFFALANTNTDANGQQYCPLHVYDLTTVPNNNINGNAVGYQLVTDTPPDALIQWNSLWGQDFGGTVQGPYYQYEKSEQNSSQLIINKRYIQHDWFDVRMVCYGARQQPTYYDVMVVKYSRDYLQPCGYVNPLQLDAEDQAAHYQYWQGMVKNISYNAILPGNRDAFKGMVVLKRFRFTIQPSSTTDSDRNPNMRIVKFFVKDYRIRDHDWSSRPLSTPAEVDGPNFGSIDTSAERRNHPIDKERLFLIVRASNTTPTTFGENSVNNTPSYDLMIRKQVRYLA